MAEREQRLDDIESSVADLRDEADEIWLSEIANQLQQVTHTLETMNVKIEGLHNRMKATRLLRFAIGAAVGVMLLERLFYAN